MTITKEQVVKRYQELSVQKNKLVMDASACDGAMQDCLFWLNFLDSVEQEKAPLQVAKPEE